MFGYIVVNKPELKIKDFDKYQQYYCGLCQSLKKTHGKISQLTLNNDLTFVGILLTIGFNVYDRIRKKDYKGAGKEIRNGLEELKQMSEELKGKEDEK